MRDIWFLRLFWVWSVTLNICQQYFSIWPLSLNLYIRCYLVCKTFKFSISVNDKWNLTSVTDNCNLSLALNSHWHLTYVTDIWPLSLTFETFISDICCWYLTSLTETLDTWHKSLGIYLSLTFDLCHWHFIYVRWSDIFSWFLISYLRHVFIYLSLTLR